MGNILHILYTTYSIHDTYIYIKLYNKQYNVMYILLCIHNVYP